MPLKTDFVDYVDKVYATHMNALGTEVNAVSGALSAAKRRGAGIFFVTEDFGAVGDGVADDHDAIMEAITAAVENGGGTIYVPPGDYALSEPIAPVGMDTAWDGAAANVRLVGLGYRGLVGLEAGGARLLAKGDYPVIGGWWLSCEITNLGMDAGHFGSPAIHADFSKCIVSHNEIENWVSYGMLLGDNTYKGTEDPMYLNKIEYNNIAQSDGLGLFASWRMWDSYLRYNNIGSTDANIRTEAGPHKIHHNWFDGGFGPKHNIHMAAAGHTTEIIGNYCEHSREEAVLIERPAWETGDRRLSFRIDNNTIINGGIDTEWSGPAVSVIGNAEGDTGKLVGLMFNGNQMFDDLGGNWTHALNLENLQSVTVIGNDWSNTYNEPEPMRIVNCEDVQVFGNAGGQKIKTT